MKRGVWARDERSETNGEFELLVRLDRSALVASSVTLPRNAIKLPLSL